MPQQNSVLPSFIGLSHWLVYSWLLQRHSTCKGTWLLFPYRSCDCWLDAHEADCCTHSGTGFCVCACKDQVTSNP
jgi:hypothetical protein